MASAGEIRFDGWTLRPGSGELFRDGRKVRLQSQPLLVLEELLARPGEMVTREQLIARLWPKGIVDFDTALNSTVRRLRTALGDHADTPRYIETIPKRGYRFIATLETVAATPLPVTPPDHVMAESPLRSTEASGRSRRTAALLAVVTVAASMAALAAWTWSRSARVERAAAVEAPAPVPATASQRYQQARFLLQRRHAGDTARAREHFEAALGVHPGYARAWAGIASTWWIATMEGDVPLAHGLVKTREAAERALQIEPNVAEAHLRLANVAWKQGDRAAGDAHLRAATAAEPDDPLVLNFASSEAALRGRIFEAIALQRRAVAADPLAVASRHNLAVLLFIAGRFDEARAEVLENFQLTSSPDPSAERLFAQALVLSGQYDAALEYADRMTDAAGRLQVQALAFHALGRASESESALRALTAQAGGPLAYLVAEVHAFRGEADPAFAWLHDAANADFATCGATDCWPLAWLPELPLLRPLQQDSRWNPWVSGVRARTTG